MSDEAAILAAILAYPDEDTPRLAYADWLDEHHQHDRAEFIRIQCGIDLDGEGKSRAFELEQWHGSRWLTGMPGLEGLNWEFHRGFPEELCGGCDRFLVDYAELSRVPWLRFVAIRGITQWNVEELLRCPWNPRWVELELQAYTWGGSHRFQTGAPSTATITAVANCPQVARLRCLRFSRFEVAWEAARELVASPYLENLQKLRLDHTPDDPTLASLRARFGNRLVIG